jgi:actin related protein 2/3 complex subunit 2
MIFLESNHRIVANVLEGIFYREKAGTVDVKAGDFDGGFFRILSDSKKKSVVTVSVQLNGVSTLHQFGLNDHLKQVFGSSCSILSSPHDGYDLTLEFDSEALSASDKELLLREIPLLKRHAIAPVFNRCCDDFASGKAFGPIKVAYRAEESVYLTSKQGNFITVFSMKFKDKDDIIFARVFLHEFQESRRDRALGNCPAVSYSHGKPPLELDDCNETEGEGADLGYVSFVLFKPHLAGEKRVKSLDHLLSFRSYFHYHLKCSKAYMHSRMRLRVDELLTILNRAKAPKKPKQKKTASGKTFEMQ